MKKFNFLKLFLVLMSFCLSHVQAMVPKEEHEKTRMKTMVPTKEHEKLRRKAMCSKKDVKRAIKLAKSAPPIKFDPSAPWLTLEEINYGYNGQSYSFYAANSFNPESLWGEIAIYPEGIKPSLLSFKLNGPGFFSDRAPYSPLAHMHYEYSAEEDGLQFFLEKVKVIHSHPYFSFQLNHVMYDDNSREDFFYRACILYFLHKFVTRTNVPHVAWQKRDLEWIIYDHY